MTMGSALTWWLAALLVAMLEVSSGSFYLLAVALGLASVGLGLFLGLGLPLALSGGSGHIVPRMVDDDTGQESKDRRHCLSAGIAYKRLCFSVLM